MWLEGQYFSEENMAALTFNWIFLIAFMYQIRHVDFKYTHTHTCTCTIYAQKVKCSFYFDEYNSTGLSYWRYAPTHNFTNRRCECWIFMMNIQKGTCHFTQEETLLYFSTLNTYCCETNIVQLLIVKHLHRH